MVEFGYHVQASQPAFTCSKLTIETLEQGVKMFKVKNKDTRMTPNMLKVNFEHISHLGVSIVNFEHVIAGWDCS